MANIIGTKGNDTLMGTDPVGSNLGDTINGLAGNDTITGSYGDDTLTGGGGNDQFVEIGFSSGTDTITDFGGVGKGTNPAAAVIAEVDTLNFRDYDLLTARNLLLTQNGSNLEITFEDVSEDARFERFMLSGKVILQNFKLENFQNLKASGAKPAVGNILFSGETSITDSFHVFDANSTDTSLGIKNTVTFLNDLDNNITGLDDSDDVINGQGGNDKIDGKSGNDLLRGGRGNDTLIGGVGNDTLIGDAGDNSLVGGTGDDNLNVNNLEGNNLLSGGDGNDYLFASGESSVEHQYILFGNPIIGNNTLNGGTGKDTLNANYSTGNNTLNGDAGDDSLNIQYSTGNNLLSGGAGNDSLSVSGFYSPVDGRYSSGNNILNGDAGDDNLDASYTYGNNTLNGGIGDDYLNVEYAGGNNLLCGGDGNDSFYVSTSSSSARNVTSLVTQTVDGGKGDDLLSADYSHSGGITTTFNATTNIRSITSGGSRVSYKNIERLNILGTAYNDNIVGSNGNDTLSPGGGGNDTIDGGKGDDLLSVNYDATDKGITSTINATTNTGSITNGTDRVSYKNIERLNISGTADDDNIVGSNGNDTLSTGGGGNDTIDGGKGDDVLSANYESSGKGITTTFNSTTNTGLITDGRDRVSYKNIERLDISGTPYDDNIVGSNGNDTLSISGFGYNSTSNDTIDGGKGDDVLVVNYRDATKGITTTFNATTNIGSITGGTNRVSYKNIERLHIFGSDHFELIVGNNGNDTIDGNGGNDTIIGGAGNDTLSCYSGNSILYGGEGNDSLSLYGGYGTFGFNSYNEGIDTIDRFNTTTNERIQVSAAGFGGGLSSGSLKANQFTIGASATTNTQRFIYNSATGGLFFDQDGSASGFTQVQFAQLSTGLSLTEKNFVVV